MESFKKALKKRLALTAGYNGIILLFLAVIFKIGKEFALPELAVGFTSGILVGFQAVMIFFMSKYVRAIRNEEKLKALYIEENDERNKYIESKIGGTGVNVIIWGITLGTIVSAFFNETVFFTLLFTVLFSSLTKGVLKLYYRNKL